VVRRENLADFRRSSQFALGYLSTYAPVSGMSIDRFAQAIFNYHRGL
jgi:hypothetical protein